MRKDSRKRVLYGTLVIFAGLSMVFSNYEPEMPAVGAAWQAALTEAQLAKLTPEELPQFNGRPVLPLYTIQAATFRPARHPVPAAQAQGQARKVGLQVGHWRSQEMPAELAALRGSQGGQAAGISEPDVNLDIAGRLKEALARRNIEAEILPAAVPVGYSAGAFVSLHCDWSTRPAASGFKVARSRYSLLPGQDDRLLQLLYEHYGQATGLKPEWNLTRNMTAYYAFNRGQFQASLAATTPAVIIEMGFLTNQSDRTLLLTQPERVVEGIAAGLAAFLDEQAARPTSPAPDLHAPVLAVSSEENRPVPVLEIDSSNPLAYVSGGQQFAYFRPQGAYYEVWLPVLNRFGRVGQDSARIISN